MISYVERSNIDAAKWDRCIDTADNGLVYARAAFLDALSPGWSALVADDYETVMPLTHRKKYGISYLCQPAYLQQLGVFGKSSGAALNQFIELARKHFRFAEIHLNYANLLPGTAVRKNFILSLDKPYEQTESAYSPVHIKNLKRATNTGLRYSRSQSYEANVNLNYKLYSSRIPDVKRSDYDAIISLSKQEPEHLISREVWKDDELQASCVCFRDRRRVYFIMSTVTETGKKNQANHFLVDSLIREFSGQGLTLDFEGSDMPGVADFYQGFGAVDQPYYFLKWNELPWPLKLFKK